MLVWLINIIYQSVHETWKPSWSSYYYQDLIQLSTKTAVANEICKYSLIISGIFTNLIATADQHQSFW